MQVWRQLLGLQVRSHPYVHRRRGTSFDRCCSDRDASGTDPETLMLCKHRAGAGWPNMWRRLGWNA